MLRVRSATPPLLSSAVTTRYGDTFSLFCQYCKQGKIRTAYYKSLGVEQFKGFFQVSGIGGFQS
jgi:hypothetical protein